MEKPIAKERIPILDYHEIIRYIEKKYNINTRDYNNLFGQKGHFQKYQDETEDIMPLQGHYPDCPGNVYRTWKNGDMKECSKEEYDRDYKLIHEQYARYQDWTKYNPEPLYLDYWHWLVDREFYEVRNGCEQHWNIKDILEEEDAPEWVKEITQLVYNEYKDQLDEFGGLDVWIEW